MILGQLMMKARQTKNTPLPWSNANKQQCCPTLVGEIIIIIQKIQNFDFHSRKFQNYRGVATDIKGAALPQPPYW